MQLAVGWFLAHSPHERAVDIHISESPIHAHSQRLPWYDSPAIAAQLRHVRMRAHHISENPETEGRRPGGPVTPDLTLWDLNKADCRIKCSTSVENSKPLLLIGSTIDFGAGDKQQARASLHLAFICALYETEVRRGRYFLHTHFRMPQTVGISMFPDTLRTVTDSCLFGPKKPWKGMKTLTGWLTNNVVTALPAVFDAAAFSSVDKQKLLALVQHGQSKVAQGSAAPASGTLMKAHSGEELGRSAGVWATAERGDVPGAETSLAGGATSGPQASSLLNISLHTSTRSWEREGERGGFHVVGCWER